MYNHKCNCILRYYISLQKKLRCVVLIVYSEKGQAGEPLLAQVTRVRLLTSMRSHVHDERRTLTETLVAIRTYIRFLLRVYPNMITQSTVLSERLPAVFTRVWLDARVHLQVFREITGRDLLAAYIAHGVQLLGADVNVLLVRLDVVERLRARATHEAQRGRRHVVSIRGLVREYLIAVIALNGHLRVSGV